MRKALVALALLFLLLHVLWAPPTLDDIDAVNFALGVRDFDVAAHQPHPPGYPVFIAAAKVVAGGLHLVGVGAPEVRALSFLNALAGALTIPLLFLLFRHITSTEEVAALAACVVAVAPLFWFTALRPLSDVTGLAFATGAQVSLLAAAFPARVAHAAIALAAGTFLAGLSIGVRSQSVFLTLPLAVLALVRCRSWRAAAVAIATGAAGMLVWAVPLVAASGGIDGFVAALGSQAGEDLVGSVMLWRLRTPRALLNGLQSTFLWPWGGLLIGGVVAACAAAGALRLALKEPRGFFLLLVAFAPYALFHLVFQETPMTRYALPVIPPLALLAVYAWAQAGAAAVRAGAIVFAVVAAALSVPASWTYAHEPAPGAQAVIDAVALDAGNPIGMHAVMRRHEQWYHDNASGRVLRARHGREVLAVVDRWRQQPSASVNFIADPSRSDLAMLDGRSRELIRSYRWGFPEVPFVAGARPMAVDLYRMRPPAWMLDQGWALTAEVAGQSFRGGARPDLRPSTAWIHARSEETLLLIGGRHLGPSEARPAQVSLDLPSRHVATFDVSPGFFFRTIVLPAGALASPADVFLPLSVRASGVASSDKGVSLEQFDLQGPGTPMFGFAEGWQEPEYNPLTGLAWRWMSDRGTLWVRPIGRDVTLTLRVESPLRYFQQPPSIRVTVGDQEVAHLSPNADFEWTVTLPHELVAQREGQVVIHCDKWFVPGGADTTRDQRRLALRVYSVRVD